MRLTLRDLKGTQLDAAISRRIHLFRVISEFSLLAMPRKLDNIPRFASSGDGRGGPRRGDTCLAI